MKLLKILSAAVLGLAVLSCGNTSGGDAGNAATSGDTLHVVTLYGPTSYFLYRGEPMGYDYTLVDSMAADMGKVLDLKVANNLSAAVAMLDSGTVDLIAYSVPITAHYLESVLPCGPENISEQVLVQPRLQGSAQIGDVTELIGRDVYVEEDSKYLRRLENLDQEIGGGINIHTVATDSLITEDLVHSTYVPGLDVSLPVSFAQRASWAVAPGNTALADAINKWFEGAVPQHISDELLKQFFEQTKYNEPTRFDFTKGYISAYDDLFRRYAPNVGWDWRFLAAQAYQESLFNPKARSWVGARGLMQIMPSTGRGYGIRAVNRLNDPETSVSVATRLIADLDRYLKDYVPSDAERSKFILAAYNAGIAHVYDAIALAKKYGMDPQKWDDNVEKAILMLMNKKYYNDPVVRFGYCRGTETAAYVRNINKFYQQAQRHISA